MIHFLGEKEGVLIVMIRYIVIILLLCVSSMGCLLEREGSDLNEISYVELRSLPILEDGRIKPLETYAQNVLLRFSGRRSLNKRKAIDWLANVMFGKAGIEEEKIFLVNHPDIAYALEITPEKRRRYSYSQFSKRLPQIINLARMSSKISSEEEVLWKMKLYVWNQT